MEVINGELREVTEQDINPDGSFTFPEGVTSIGRNAFRGCSNLEQIEIPEGVTSIGEGAFEDCGSLKQIGVHGHSVLGQILTSDYGRATEISKELMYITPMEEGHFCISKERMDEKSCAVSPDIKSALDYDANHKWVEYGYMPSEYVGDGYEPTEITRELVSGYIKARRSISESGIMYSNGYNSNNMDVLLYRMMQLIGAEEIKKMLKVDKISEEDLNQRYPDIFERAKILEKYFEKRYVVEGIDGIAISLIKEIDKKYSTLKGKEKKEKYKGINECLSQGNYEEFNRILEETFGKEGLTELQGITRNKVTESIANRIGTKNAELAEELRIPDAQLDVAKRMIKRYIKESGSKNVEDIEKWFAESTGHDTDFAAQWIQDKRETIINLINESITENTNMLLSENVIFEVLKQVRKGMNSQWIRDIITLGNKSGFTEAELGWLFNEGRFWDQETFEMFYGEGEYVVPPKLEYRAQLALKSGVHQKDCYRKISCEGRFRIGGIITYKQIETMFGGIEVDNLTPKELENFKKYYKRYRDEILSDERVQRNLSEICVRVKNGQKMDVTPQALEVETSGQQRVIPKDGDSELAQSLAYAMQYNSSQEDYIEEYRNIYTQMKERESITIPPIRVGTRETGKYFGKILRADDPLAISIGTITGCCQEFGNAGETSMRHSVKAPNGGVFVVFDERGEVVAQSWTWRMGNRLCFDNIERAKDREVNQTEIYDIYKRASEKAMELDTNMMNKLLKDGKITLKQYMEYSLREAVVGMGSMMAASSQLVEKLRENPVGTITGVGCHYYSDARGQVRVLVKRDEEDIRKNAESIGQNIEVEATQNQSCRTTVPYGYKKMDEIEFISSEYIGRKLEQIKEIERIAFVENQQALQDCESVGDISDKYDIPIQNLRLATNRDSTFYIIYGDDPIENRVYIADMAMLNGVNSQNRASSKNELSDDDPRKRGDILITSAEALVASYQVLLNAAKKGRNIEMDATDNTSLINLKNMAKRGLITIHEGEKYNDGVDKTPVSLEVNIDEMKKALEELAEKLNRRQDLMVTYAPLSKPDRETDMER